VAAAAAEVADVSASPPAESPGETVNAEVSCVAEPAASEVADVSVSAAAEVLGEAVPAEVAGEGVPPTSEAPETEVVDEAAADAEGAAWVPAGSWLEFGGALAERGDSVGVTSSCGSPGLSPVGVTAWSPVALPGWASAVPLTGSCSRAGSPVAWVGSPGVGAGSPGFRLGSPGV